MRIAKLDSGHGLLNALSYVFAYSGKEAINFRDLGVGTKQLAIFHLPTLCQCVSGLYAHICLNNMSSRRQTYKGQQHVTGY